MKKHAFVVGISVALFCLASTKTFGQDLDDTLDAELDALSKSAPSPPATSVKLAPSTARNQKAAPSVKDSFDDSLDEPLNDPFADDEKA